MTLYINLDFRNRKFQTYSDRYGFKKFDYLLDCIKFIENNPLGVDYVRFDLGWSAEPMIDFCESIGMDYDRYFKIEPQTDYKFQEICKSMDSDVIESNVNLINRLESYSYKNPTKIR